YVKPPVSIKITRDPFCGVHPAASTNSPVRGLERGAYRPSYRYGIHAAIVPNRSDIREAVAVKVAGYPLDVVRPAAIALGPINRWSKPTACGRKNGECCHAAVVPDGGDVAEAVAIEVAREPGGGIDPRPLIDCPMPLRSEAGACGWAQCQGVLSCVIPHRKNITESITVKITGKPTDRVFLTFFSHSPLRMVRERRARGRIECESCQTVFVLWGHYVTDLPGG